MKVDELKEAGKALYGYGWQTALASALGIDGSTVRRWIGSGVAIPAPAAAAIRSMTTCARLRAVLLARGVSACAPDAVVFVPHLTDVERHAFRASIDRSAYRIGDDEPRTNETVLTPVKMQDKAPEKRLLLSVDDAGTIHLKTA